MIDPVEFGLKFSCVNHIIFLSLDCTVEALTKSMQVGQKEPSKCLFFQCLATDSVLFTGNMGVQNI